VVRADLDPRRPDKNAALGEVLTDLRPHPLDLVPELLDLRFDLVGLAFKCDVRYQR
jgi:hypothetical protein